MTSRLFGSESHMAFILPRLGIDPANAAIQKGIYPLDSYIPEDHIQLAAHFSADNAAKTATALRATFAPQNASQGGIAQMVLENPMDYWVRGGVDHAHNEPFIASKAMPPQHSLWQYSRPPSKFQ